MHHRDWHPNTFPMRDCDRSTIIEQRNSFLRIAAIHWRAGRRPTALRPLPHLPTCTPQLRSIVEGRHKSDRVTFVKARFSWSFRPFANTAQSAETMSMLQGEKTESTSSLAIQSASAQDPPYLTSAPSFANLETNHHFRACRLSDLQHRHIDDDTPY